MYCNKWKIYLKKIKEEYKIIANFQKLILMIFLVLTNNEKKMSK